MKAFLLQEYEARVGQLGQQAAPIKAQESTNRLKAAWVTSNNYTETYV